MIIIIIKEKMWLSSSLYKSQVSQWPTSYVPPIKRRDEAILENKSCGNWNIYIVRRQLLKKKNQLEISQLVKLGLILT